MARYNQTLTITALTPVRLATEKLMVNRYLVQMKHGATVGLGYIMAGIGGGRTPVVTAPSDLSGELYAATADAPGGVWTDEDEYHGIDLSTVWIDVAVTGTKVIVTWDEKV